ncbi:MAG: DUF2336 domain-containing protein [Rhodospirillales bacterium]|nr:DUF2336 domain-containing protein [Rhodospirillales bacterium]
MPRQEARDETGARPMLAPAPAFARTVVSGDPANPRNGLPTAEADRAGRDETEQHVRQALAAHVLRSPHLPPSLARGLAADIHNLPLPSEPFATAETGPSTNGGCGELARIHQRIVSVAEAIRDMLIRRHGLPAPLVDEIVMHGRERALTAALEASPSHQELEQLASDLMAEDRLTPTLMLRCLCLGKLQLFEAAMAALAGTTSQRVHWMLYEGGPHEFFRLYELTALPLGFYRAFRAALDVVTQLGRDAAVTWHRDVTKEIIARLVKAYEQVSPEDLEHVLSQLSHRLTAAAEPNGTKRRALA